MHASALLAACAILALSVDPSPPAYVASGAVLRGHAVARYAETPFQCHASATPNRIGVLWCSDAAGVWRAVRARSGVVRRRTAQQIRACLRDKHVVLIGDSRVRYQYLSLAHLLATGAWPRCMDDSPWEEDCMFVNERRSTAWTQFYEHTNLLLNAANASERCDCCRDFAGCETRENRFFAADRMRVTYLQSFRDAIQLSPGFVPAVAPTPCQPGRCTGPAASSGPVLRVLSALLPALRPTHVLASTGWNDLDIDCELAAMGHGDVQYYALRTPVRGPVTLRPPACGVRVLDRAALVEGAPGHLFWDGYHLLGSANEEMNHAMLDMICGPVE